MSVEPPRRARHESAGLDPATIELVHAATSRLTEQVVRAANTSVDAGRLARQHGNLTVEQRAGFVFELMHADGFNRRALAAGVQARAVVNGLNGAPHAAADLRLVGADGAIRDVQAKVYEKPVRAAIRLADPAYRGMDRLGPADQVQGIDSVYDRRLRANPSALRAPDHADARAHLVDRLRMDGVESSPVMRDEAIRAARGPRRWADRRLAVDAGRQIGAATAVGAASGATFAGLVEAARHVGPVRSGETSMREATRAVAGAAAGGTVRNGAVAGLEATLQVAALRSAAVAGLVGKVPAGVVASALVGIAESALNLARGDIDVSQFALQACESTFVSGVSWMGGAVGQALVPVPLVGAVLGGFAAQWCATQVTEVLRSLLAPAADETQEAEPVVRALSPVADELQADAPAVDAVDELDAWLADPDACLVLDPNVVVAAAA